MDVLNNVSNQVSSWLPFSKKAETTGTPVNETETKKDGKESQPVVENKASEKVKDGNDSGQSSSTGSPDHESAPATPDETILDDVSQRAKTFGSFLYSAVNKAGKSVTEAGAKLRKTVEETSIIGEFNKEQDEFIQSKQKCGESVPPWTGYTEQDALKEQILQLSTERRNFVRSPPSGVQFQYDYNTMYPVAVATMKEDPNLDKMRYELVPKIVKEDVFWRNYFYRVSLICQSTELSSLATSPDNKPITKNVDSSPDDSEPEAHLESTPGEFVSDSFKASDKDLEAVRKDMKKLGVGKNDDEWERELESELQDYEVVAGQVNSADVEDDLNDIIETDLK